MGNTSTKETGIKRGGWTARTYEQIGQFFGVKIASVKRWAGEGMPRGQPYRLDRIAQWLRQKGPWRARPGLSETGDPLLVGSDSPALEQYRRQRARLAELDVAEREGKLISREKLHAAMAKFAGVIRQAGEVLQRQYGTDAHKVLDDALVDAMRNLDWIAGDDSDGERTGNGEPPAN